MQAALREQPVLQPEEPQLAMRLGPPLRAAWEQQQGQPRVHLALEQLEPPREPRVSQQGQPAARLAPPQEQRVSQPQWVPRPQELEEPPAAYALPWLQLPSLRLPPWRQLPPLPQLQPVPKGFCELSPRHLQGSSSNASSFP